MSVLFMEDGVEIWDISHNTGRLAVGHIRSLESVLGVPSGIGNIVADEVLVDTQQLLTFVSAACRHLRVSRSRTFQILFRSPLVVAVGLLRKSPKGRVGLEAAVDAELILEGAELVR